MLIKMTLQTFLNYAAIGAGSIPYLPREIREHIRKYSTMRYTRVLQVKRIDSGFKVKIGRRPDQD